MISPTVSPTAAASEPWDVVVIGAGPAGAIAARQLARAGTKTLLVDGASFPRAKVCGGCINQRALALLEQLEIHSPLKHAHPAPLERLSLSYGQRRLELPIPAGRAIPRDAFDAALVTEAIAGGAAFLPRASAAVVREPAFLGRCVRLRMSDGESVDVEAQIVVAADGLNHSSLKAIPEFASRISPSARVGLGAEVTDNSENYEPGIVHMCVADHGYVGIVRSSSGTIGVAAAVEPSLLQRSASPADAVRSILDSAMRPIPTALIEAHWRGTPPLTRKSNCLAAGRVFLIGDASGYVEPFTGEGIAWAILSAVAVVPKVLRGLKHWNEQIAQDWQAVHRRLLYRDQANCLLVAQLLRRGKAVRAAMTLISAFPSLTRPIVRRMNSLPAVLQEMQ